MTIDFQNFEISFEAFNAITNGQAFTLFLQSIALLLVAYTSWRNTIVTRRIIDSMNARRRLSLTSDGKDEAGTNKKAVSE